MAGSTHETMDAARTLTDCRERIDRIDAVVVALLRERVRTALEAGQAKRLLGQPIAAPAREEEVLSRLLALCNPPLDGDAVRRIFHAIIEETRNLEMRVLDDRPPAQDCVG
jgi:chorismate mutase